MEQKFIHLSRIVHRDSNQIRIDFSYGLELISRVKTIEGAKWSQTNKCWYIPDSRDAVQKVINAFRGKAWADYTALNEQLVEENKSDGISKEKKRPANLDTETLRSVAYFKLWMEQKRYSRQTVKNYLNQLVQFLRYHQPRSHKELTVEDVERYNHDVIIKNGLSVSFQRGLVGAVKLFYSVCRNTKMNLDKLQRPFKEHTLPEVLSKEEVQKIINATGNIKHKAMLSVTYACGMRRSEVLNLKLKGLDKTRKLIRIEQGKGKKGRYVPGKIPKS